MSRTARRRLALLAAALLAALAPRPAAAEAGVAPAPATITALARVEARITALLGDDLALTSVRPHRPLPATAAEVSVSFRTAPRPGVQTVNVTVVDGRGQPAQTWAEVRLAPVRVALVAKRALTAGAQLAPSDVALERVIGASGRLLEVSPDELEGARVLRDLAVGAPIAADALELPPPLPRGTALRVLIRVGAVQVASEGTLERPARAGEPAAARLRGTARLVHGRLADRGTLIVEGGRP